MSSYRELLRLCVAVHAVALSSVRTADAWEVAVFVEVALLHVPEAFGERVFGAFSGDSEECWNDEAC